MKTYVYTVLTPFPPRVRLTVRTAPPGHVGQVATQTLDLADVDELIADLQRHRQALSRPPELVCQRPGCPDYGLPLRAHLTTHEELDVV
jgi:hypothetical protein